jgi:integrase
VLSYPAPLFVQLEDEDLVLEIGAVIFAGKITRNPEETAFGFGLTAQSPDWSWPRMPELRKRWVTRFRLHDLRHSCASFLLSQGASPRVVMEILGHSGMHG